MKNISENTPITLGLTVLIAGCLVSVGTYIGTISTQAKAITDLTTRVETIEKDRKEALRIYAGDMLDVKMALTRIETVIGIRQKEKK